MAILADGETSWYRNLRRNDRALDRAETLRLIDANCYGVLALAWPDGSPYAVPINYGRAGETIYMHCATAGQKLDILRVNPKAMLSVVEPGQVTHGETTCSASINFRSAMIFGKVSEVGDLPAKLHGLKVVCQACAVPVPIDGTANAASFASRANDTVVLALHIEHVSGKARS